VNRMDSRTRLGLLLGGIGIAMLVVMFSPLASGEPDGLERVAEDKGFIDTAEDAPYSVIPDYAFPGVENEAVATILAGLVGVVIVVAIVLLAGAWLGRERPGREGSPGARGGSA
jgi:hypothetical protein